MGHGWQGLELHSLIWLCVTIGQFCGSGAVFQGPGSQRRNHEFTVITDSEHPPLPSCVSFAMAQHGALDFQSTRIVYWNTYFILPRPNAYLRIRWVSSVEGSIQIGCHSCQTVGLSFATEPGNSPLRPHHPPSSPSSQSYVEARVLNLKLSLCQHRPRKPDNIACYTNSVPRSYTLHLPSPQVWLLPCLRSIGSKSHRRDSLQPCLLSHRLPA